MKFVLGREHSPADPFYAKYKFFRRKNLKNGIKIYLLDSTKKKKKKCIR